MPLCELYWVAKDIEVDGGTKTVIRRRRRHRRRRQR